MKLNTARIFVRKLEEAKDFYLMIGLKLQSFNLEQGFCIFDVGETKLIIEAISEFEPQEEQDLVGRFTGLSFSTKDIIADYKYLKQKGVKFSGAPEEQFWGGYLATFFDPSNNQIQLVQETV